MKQANDIASHQPYDNSICEYLVMLKEACAAYGTVTNIECKFILNTLKNIALNNGIPGAAGSANDKAGIGGDVKNIDIECTKIIANSVATSETLYSQIASDGFAGELMSMASDHLLGKYCVNLSGDLSENYRCIVRNKNQIAWWDYNYSTSGIISLRCPKNNINGGIMKMKGNIEGNATHFYLSKCKRN
ncbi:MAG: hypothetical protein JST17_15455 [Bacteroidetes bacterium]|nr:hypothetical protein [Bacteroidota bacterium]MBS1930581.1 hypothetical protein [Bacteroidota bacterium]